MKTLFISIFTLAFLVAGTSNTAIAKNSSNHYTVNEIQFKVINDLGHDFTYMNGLSTYTIKKDGNVGFSFAEGAVLTTINSKGKMVTFIKITADLTGKSFKLSELLKK
jgi:hypothetical protein